MLAHARFSIPHALDCSWIFGLRLLKLTTRPARAIGRKESENWPHHSISNLTRHVTKLEKRWLLWTIHLFLRIRNESIFGKILNHTWKSPTIDGVTVLKVSRVLGKSTLNSIPC